LVMILPTIVSSISFKVEFLLKGRILRSRATGILS
jgi:hypothetical protein